MESGQLGGQLGKSNHVYYLISKGKLQEAHTFVAQYPEIKPRVLRVLAASEGVDQIFIKDALSLTTDEGIDFDSIWLALGTAVREGVASKEYIDTLELMVVDRKMLAEFIQLTKQNSTEALEAVIKSLDFRVKSRFYALGTKILSEKAPQNWKIYTQSLLFTNERPFVKI